jgi:uncharacterized protein (TIGR03083 family)
VTSPEPAAFLASLEQDRDRLGALPPDQLGTPVPTCPGWTVQDLLDHLGRVHRWAAEALDRAPEDQAPAFPPRPDPDTDRVAWVRDGLDHLIGALRNREEDRPCWAFVPGGTTRFWLRRQAIETATHRWDAQAAIGAEPDPIDPSIAAAGIDEWCELRTGMWSPPEDLGSGSIHLHATDGQGEWFVEIGPDGFRWEHGHRKGDVALRGSRSELLLALQGRVGAPEVLGDRAFLGRVLAATAV